MKEIIIVEKLSKMYHLGETIRHNSLRDKFSSWCKSIKNYNKNLFHNTSNSIDNSENILWALKDISFSVQEGEVLGVIGRNGAGKSTLLKILSRITEPTSGRIIMRGRVASLLEVGTGFHPELTGRENIFLNGAILGMSRFEIHKKFTEIVSFAEIERFIDTPVKRYSSGMYVRLAFAVAAHLEPEILLIDEVLAVGDTEFQKKCLGKMNDVAKKGRTVLFVSHNMGAIAKLCKNALLIEGGVIKLLANVETVINEYLIEKTDDSGSYNPENGVSEPNVHEFKILKVNILNSYGKITSHVSSDQKIWIEIHYIINEMLSSCNVGFLLWNSEGLLIFQSYDADNKDFNDKRDKGLYVSKCLIPDNLLSPGRYVIEVYADIPNLKILARTKHILNFTVANINPPGSHIDKNRQGIIRPYLHWTMNRVDF